MVMERKFTSLLLVGLCLVVGISQYVDGRNLMNVKEENVKKPESFFGDSSGGIGVGSAGGIGGYGGIGGGIFKGIGVNGGIGGGIFKGIGGGIGGGIGAIGGVGGAIGGSMEHVDANKQP